MKLKIGEIAKRSNVPASTIRYYVQEGLLPKPQKANEKMAFYDEACIDRLQVIGQLQAKRYFPLYLIKNILRRMDEGLSLTEAEILENAVFGSEDRAGSGLLNHAAFLSTTGLTEKELKQAQQLGILIPYTANRDKPLYNQDDVRVGRDGIKIITGLGIKLQDLSFWVEFGKKIVDKEMALRRKIVTGKPTRENVAITTELTRVGEFYREYILRRLFRKQVEQNIQKSLVKKKRKTTPKSNSKSI
jgi:DNA-binding transcriptional MerR regulator